jgi:hypothetical protein
MIEIFKTNVHHKDIAGELLKQIHQNFSSYVANFDLEDCDRILRVQCIHGTVESSCIIDLVQTFGYDAEILPDDVPQEHVASFSFYAARL